MDKNLVGTVLRRHLSTVMLAGVAAMAIGCAPKGPTAAELTQRAESAASRADAAAQQAAAAADRADMAAERAEAIFRKHMRK